MTPPASRGLDVLGSGPLPRRRRWVPVATVAALVVVTAVVAADPLGRPRQSLGAVTLDADGATRADGAIRGDGTLVVTLANRGSAVRVTGLELRGGGLAATTAGALADEVATAQERGVPPVHDAARPLPPGRHPLVLGVRAACPSRRPVPVQLLVRVESGGQSRTLAGNVADEVLAGLRCVPLSVRAGISPAATADGEVALLLTAHSGQSQGSPGFQRLAWPGYHLSEVGGVVPLALGWAGEDSDVVFGTVVTTDCTSRPAGGLTAVFARGSVPVSVTDAAVARVRALRATCP